MAVGGKYRNASMVESITDDELALGLFQAAQLGLVTMSVTAAGEAIYQQTLLGRLVCAAVDTPLNSK